MAEQYQSFQGKEPNIDINLFPNATSAGINQGNAQETTFGAIVGGISGGITTGIQTAQGIQGIRQNENTIEAGQLQNEINRDPKVAQARKDQIIYDAELTKAKAQSLGDATSAKADHAKAKLDLAKAEQGYEDITNQETITTALDDPSTPPEKIQELISKASGTMGRDNAFAMQTIARSQGRVDPTFLETVTKGVNAVEIEKKRLALDQSTEKRVQQQALKQDEEVTAATAILQLSPRIKNVMQEGLNGQPYDPSKFNIVRAGDVEIDPKTKLPKFDAGGSPIVTASPNADDKRFFATYAGETIDTLGGDDGKKYFDAFPKYQIGTNAILGRTKLTPTEAKRQVSELQTENTGLAADEYRINKQLAEASPQSTSGKPILSPEVLEGKSPEEQAAITARFNQQVEKLKSVPREFRNIVTRVNSDPLLAGQTPIIKAMVSQESAGNRTAKSPVRVDSQGNKMGGVQGLMQVTSNTFDYVKKKYPRVIGKADKYSPQGSLLAGKMYLLDMLTTTEDLEMALAAYNAGPGPILSARAEAGRNATWASIKPLVAKYVSPEKYEEVKDYPESVLKFYSFYNG